MLLAVASAAAQGGKEQDDILATVNGDFVAENLLVQARQTAAGGDYDAASHRYLMLIEEHGGTVVRVEGLLYQPVWRQVVDDLLRWPASGLVAFRQQVDPQAAAAYRRAVADNDLAALGRLVRTRFLSATGDRAAIALADRLVESGRFSLAAYYYLLVLEKYPDSQMSPDRLRARALVATKLAGLEGRAAELARQLQGRRIDRFHEGTLQELDRMAAARSEPDRRMGGRDHMSNRPTGVPSAVAWVRPLTSQPLGSRYPLSSAPVPCATYDRGLLYVTFQTSVWSLRADSGEILWRHDTDGRSGDKDPVHFYYEQAHCPLVTEEAIITPISRGGREVVQGRVGGVVDLVALRPDDGQRLWRWSPGGKDLGTSPLAVDTAPVVEGDRLFVPLATMANLFGEVQTAMLDRRTGSLLWQQGIGSHNNQLPLGRWSLPAAPFSTALQLRDGVLLSCGGGLVTAQSAVSGTILWSRQMPQRRDYEVKLKLLKELPGMSFNGQVNSRRPQVLSSGHLVIGSDVTTRQVVACDLLTGRAIWTEPAGDSAQPLALRGDRVYFWGRTLQARDLATGRGLWEVPLGEKEVMAATPLVTGTDAYLPTNQRLMIVRLSDGKPQRQIPWLDDRLPGNLLLVPEGLVVIEPRNIVLYELWDALRKRLLAAATANATDPSPLVELGRAAVQIGRVSEGLDLLAQALARSVGNVEATTSLYLLLEQLLAGLQDGVRAEFSPRMIDQMRSCAVTSETIARQALIEGRLYSESQPTRSLLALHRVFASADVRNAEVSDVEMGRGPAGFVAERLIAHVIGRKHPQLMAPFETKATEARQRAAMQSDPAAALHEAALQYPTTVAARVTLEAELASLEGAKQYDRAAALLRRLLVVAADDESQWRYRLALAENLRRTGRTDQARFAAQAVNRNAPPGLKVRQGEKLVDAAQAAIGLLARLPEPDQARSRRVDLPAGPYKALWTFNLPAKPTATLTPVADCRSAGGRARQPLLAVNRHGIWALDRKDGSQLWHREVDLKKQPRGVVPVLLLDETTTVGIGGDVLALDPTTGDVQWRAVFEPTPEAANHSLLAAMARGMEMSYVPQTFQVMRLDLLGGLIRVETTHSVHLLDPAEGYSVATAVVPKNSRELAFLFPQADGPVVLGVFANGDNLVRAWDLAAGRPLAGFKSDGKVAILGPGATVEQALLCTPAREAALVDLTLGKELWRYQGGPLFGRRTACRIAGQLAVGTWDGRLVALNPTDGKPTWASQLGSTPSEAVREVSVLDGDLLVRCARLVARVGTDGKVLWRHGLGMDEFADEVRPMRDRLLLVGHHRRREGIIAFIETLDARTGLNSRRTELPASEGPGRVNIIADEQGLLIVGSESARFYGPVSRSK